MAVVAVVVLSAVAAATPALAAEPPLATTEPASSVGASGAELHGKVNPKGVAVASCRFEFGTSPAYGQAVPCEPASLGTGKLNVPVSAAIESLEPSTTYHFRVVASSVNGATQGADRTFTTSSAPGCPNADRRREQGILAIQLPDCMALEHVSPPKKFGQRAAVVSISANAERVSFKSLSALAETPGNNNAVSGDTYVATRTDDGWITQPTSPPYPIVSGWGRSVNLARSFDPSLSRWVMLGSTIKGSQSLNAGVGQLFGGGLGGLFEPRSPLLVPVDGAAHTDLNIKDARLLGASADHSRLIFAAGEASTTYLAGDPNPNGDGADLNAYVAKEGPGGQPALELLARDSDGKAWGGNCGARVGGTGGAGIGWRNQGAVSADGTRIIFSTRPGQPEGGSCSSFTNRLRILERREAGGEVEIAPLIESECDREAPPCAPVDGDDMFQGASVDGSKVYFTTNRQLVDSDRDGEGFGGCVGFLLGGCDLYLYDATKPEGQRLTQVSAGEANPSHPTVGAGANVRNGTVAISGDGSRVYFAADGVLTTAPNPQGKTADEVAAGVPKLYTWDAQSEAVRFVGALAPGDAGLWGDDGSFLNRAYAVPVTGKNSQGSEIGGDGRILVFQSTASLTASDADGGQLDAFRYDSGDGGAASLECVSCRPGGPDAAPFPIGAKGAFEGADVPGTGFAEENRWVSEDGNTVLLRTAQSLVAADLNGLPDDYLWRSGKLHVLPGTTLPTLTLSAGVGQRPPVVSHDGEQVAFTAYTQLLPSDGDTAPDVYVARVDGGIPPSATGPNCEGEACQGPASPALPPPLPGSATHRGLGNVTETTESRGCPRGSHRVVRKGKARCVKGPRSCRKGKRKIVRKGRARCVRAKGKARHKARAMHRRVTGAWGGAK